ncbi:hypothetical protein FKR81_38850 [Lentzea tibetensis]|uniref:Lipoprotein n=1 Tax=Lentzea tibetensis TaxID=2591470 RepID=A0A563EGN0_9PSEU|nr:hypothetical protein [Lentzea tibetensis]TWP45609.1 hypothetical protein FKR81_38850 [Lentzea tibetensis]
MRRALALLAVPALALAVSACSAGAAAIPKQAAQGNEAKASDPKAMIAISESPQLGWYLTNGDGRTMYRFDADSSKPPKTTCEGECARKWPPVPADVMPMTAGVDPLVLGVVTRADGSKQLTIGGFPQYTFAEDKAPGDVKGQGSGGKWYATAPTGAKAAPGQGMPGVPGTSQTPQQQQTKPKQQQGSTPTAPPSGGAGY